MKRIALLCLAALPFFAACTQEPLAGPAELEGEQVFSAVVGDEPSTKTVLESDGISVSWTTEEQINVFRGSALSGLFRSTNTAVSKTATFRGTFSGGSASANGADYWALYPYDAEAMCDGSSVTMTVPAQQTGVAGTFADKSYPMLARSSDRNLAFYNICGGARFSVTKSGITAVTFRAVGGQTLAGKVKVGVGTDGKPQVTEVLDGASEVTVTAPEGGFEVGKYYFATMLPAVLEDGLAMVFQTADGPVDMALDRSITVRRAIFGKLDNIGPVDVTGVSLDLETVDILIGRTQALTASVSPAGATNPKINWSSSNSDVASVDKNGVVTAHAVGEATITATTEQGGFEASCVVTVNPIAVEEVTLDQTSITLTSIGATKQLNPTVTPADATVQTVTWTSSDPDVATVSASGLVTAKGSGTATIKAAVGGKEASCTVTVNIPVTGVTLNKTSTSLLVGGTETLTPAVAPTTATNTDVTWSSSNSDVASVDVTGKVTARAVGTATITVTTVDGSKTAKCTVTVGPVAVTSVTLDKSTLTFNSLSGTQTLTATVKPDNATNKEVTWSSSNTAVATVVNGVVTPKGSGTAEITASAGGKSATCTVTVHIPVTSVSMNKSTTTIYVGDTETLTATVTPANASNTNFVWSSNNNNVAIVSSDGTVTAKGVGTAIITASALEGLPATCAVTVLPVAVTSVTLNMTSLSFSSLNTTQQLTATVQPTNATYPDITWSSSNETVATVDENGTVTARDSGSAIITAETSNNKTATCSVSVNVPVSGVTLNITTLSLYEGDTETLTASVLPATATNQNVTWSSSNTSVATVSGGLVTAKANGTAVITATTEDGNKKATCTVTVTTSNVPSGMVDMGVSVYWAKMNLGASSETDEGTNYSSWKNSSTGLDNARSGGTNWRTPTKDEWDELTNNCTIVYDYDNEYVVLTSNTTGKSILLPATCYDNDDDLCACYWSSTGSTYPYIKVLDLFNDRNGWVNMASNYSKIVIRPVVSK